MSTFKSTPLSAPRDGRCYFCAVPAAEIELCVRSETAIPRLGGENVNTVMRVEKKYPIDVGQGAVLRAKLAQVMIPDEHNGAQGYTIRSMYFDTPEDSDFGEKVDGLELRRKIRLRIYDPAQDFGMLEMKQKSGPYQLKRSLRMSRADAESLTRGEYSPLLKYSEPFAAECYALMSNRCYRPKTIVEYDRTAFIARENHIRITFDSRIRASESDMDLFAPAPAYSPVMDPFGLVLEVKYNGYILSYIKDLLCDVHRPEVSVSKYCLARSFTLGAEA